MKWIKTVVLVVLSWFLLHQVAIIVDGFSCEPQASDYGVIFGNTVHPDGTLSARLQARVDRGLELYQDTLVNKLFVSGGLGKEGYYEAQAMAQYLIQKGVPEIDIIIDDEGNNTWLTATNFRSQLPEVASVIVVTQFYHISRAKLAFRKVGIEQISAASPDYLEPRDLYSLFREFFAYYKYWWRY